MAALEKKLAREGAIKEPASDVPENKEIRIMQEQPTALLVSDEMNFSCLRAPPPSLKSDSDLERYFRANVAETKNAVMMPANEPISCSDSSAIEREYDLDTWKMYHRIQSSRKHVEGTMPSHARVVSDDDDDQMLSVVYESSSVSFHEHVEDKYGDEGIFELELDS